MVDQGGPELTWDGMGRSWGGLVAREARMGFAGRSWCGPEKALAEPGVSRGSLGVASDGVVLDGPVVGRGGPGLDRGLPWKPGCSFD